MQREIPEENLSPKTPTSSPEVAQNQPAGMTDKDQPIEVAGVRTVEEARDDDVDVEDFEEAGPPDNSDELARVKAELTSATEKLRETKMKLKIQYLRAKRKRNKGNGEGGGGDSKEMKLDEHDEKLEEEAESDTILSGLKINVNEKNYYGETPLMLAASNGETVSVNALLSIYYEDIDVNATNRHGSTPIHLAAKNGHLRVVEELLAHPGINPNRFNRQGNTPLNCATLGGHLWVARKLIGDARVDVNRGRKEPPLVSAAAAGMHDIATALLRHQDIDPNLSNPLKKAVEGGHLSIVKELAGHPKIELYKDGNPLVLAAELGRPDIFKELLYHKSVVIDKELIESAKKQKNPLVMSELKKFYDRE